MGRTVVGTLTGLFVFLAAPFLRAHSNSISYCDIAVRDHELSILLRIPAPVPDLLFSLDQNLNTSLEQNEIDAKASELRAYLEKRIEVSADGRRLSLASASFSTWQDKDKNPFVEATLMFRSDGAIRKFAIASQIFTDVVADHRTLAKISLGDRTEQFVLHAGQPYQGALGSAGGFWTAFRRFLELGVFHIFTGYDHVLFLIGVLLMGGRFWNVFKIVTSFTIAHSITLALAALDVVNLPSRWVESAIALSIAYIALENLFFRNFDKRWMVTFFFGLVHGFGFANVLREMNLSRSGLVSSLFSFNFGVEIGQFLIVCLILPLLFYLRTSRAHGMVIKLASAVILGFGLFWFYQRGVA